MRTSDIAESGQAAAGPGASGPGGPDGEGVNAHVAQRSGRFNAAMGERRLHLAALDAVIVHRSADGVGEERPFGLACGVVSRSGAPPVLNVIRVKEPGRSVEVECARVGDRWWYLVVGTGEGLVPVDEVEGAPAVLASILGRESR